MKIEDFVAYVAVIRYESMSEASRVLGVPQPLLTRRVQSFEEALGAQLLDRSTKPMTPTALGMKVFERSCRVLDEVESVRELVRGGPPDLSDLRIGMTQAIGDIILPRLLPALAVQWPGFNSHVSTDWGTTLLSRVEKGELHAAALFLSRGVILPRSISGRLLQHTELAVVAQKGVWTKRSYRLVDIGHADWVLNPDGCQFRAGLQHALAECDLPLSIKLDTFGRDLQLNAIADGLGLGLVPKPILASSPLKNRVDILRIKDFQPVVDLWLIHQCELEERADVVQWFSDVVLADVHD